MKLRIFFLFLAVTTVSLAATQSRRPNIIFILADDLGYGELSCYGQRRYETPNIDRLAREGLRFTDHYAGAPVCAPSRNALMTGQHAGHLTVRNNLAFGREDGGRVPLKPTDVTIAERLRTAGYVTALIGKWGLGEEGSGAEPWRKGWDEFYGFINQQHAHNQFPEFLYRNADKEALVPNYAHVERVFANDRFTDEALQFVERKAGGEQPFFLYLAYTTPHAMLKCPPDSLAEAKRRCPELAAPDAPPKALAFAAMMLRLDRDVGSVLEKLKALGLEENTLVLFSSDNGAHIEDGKPQAYFQGSGALRGVKRDVYEGGVRVPLIARWPGKIAAGGTTAHVSAFWDFAATALEVADVKSAELPLEGISYAPTLFGRSEHQREHEALYWEFLVGGKTRQAIRLGDWKGVRMAPTLPLELYDLSTDLGEQHDVAAAQADVVKRMTELLRTMRTDDPKFPLE
ncbi:arylsulfatase [Oleiharenicola lentus]|uniref:arylsulfatase n=1 Tax=Oleiharenicola lentus TaxID=2508720 RepID=UPI003F67F86E